MKTRQISVLAVVMLAAFVGACAEAPMDVVNAARASVDAVAAEGEVYASQELSAARTAVGRMDTELETQNNAFALTRNYDQVTQLAGAVESAAAAVGSAIEAEKSRLQGETEGLVADARSELDSVRPAIAELDEEDAAGFQADVEGVEGALTQVESQLASGALTDARQGAQSALSDARGIGGRLAEMEAAEAAAVEDVTARALRGSFDLPRRAYATGTALEPGPYTVRLTDDSAPEPAGTTRWVEFVNEEDDSVAGRALAAVIPDADIDEVADGWVVRNQVSVAELREGDYVRVWLNRDGSSYFVHLPTSQ